MSSMVGIPLNDFDKNNSRFVADDSEGCKARNNKRTNHQDVTVPWRWAVFILAAGCFLFYCVYLIDSALPSVVSIREAEQNPDLFCAERSMQLLNNFTDLGARVVGSRENEELAPQLIIRQVEEIKKTAHPMQTIQYQVQKGEGAFSVDRARVYQNIKNVVVKLDGRNGTHSVLVNCHFDSRPSSLGASDDAINCAVMLELLHILSKSRIRLKHNIVFLFNGAEEVGLMGSHLFLKHKWAEQVGVVINLEAAGLGGKSLLFQTGPKNNWVFKYYARNAPHPYGQITAEEFFQNGFVPSDSDFRVFRDFGNLSGLDFAFNRNGYVYHTIYDRPEYIPGGSHQHVGDNTLAVLRKLGNAEELEDIEGNSGGSMIYFDYLGWFMMRYSFGAGVAINILVFLLAVGSVAIFMGRVLKCVPLTSPHLSKAEEEDLGPTQGIMNAGSETKLCPEEPSTLSWGGACFELSLAILIRLCGMFLALGLSCLMARFIDAVAPLAMPYFSNIYLIFQLYWCPGLVGYALLPMLYDMYRDSRCTLSLTLRCQLNLVASHSIWTLLLFIGTCASIKSSIVLMFPVLFTSLAFLLIFLTPLYKTAHSWIWVYLLVHLPSLLLQLYLTLQIYVSFIPITGRSGPINSDLYMAEVTTMLMLYVVSFVIPLMTIVRKQWVVLVILMGIFFTTLCTALPTSIGNPYNQGPNYPTPQRYFISHRERKFFNESGGLSRHDWGYVITDQDRNSPRTVPEHLQQDMVNLFDDCGTGMEAFCGSQMDESGMHWISTEDPPVHPVPLEIILFGKSWTSERCTYDFAFKGPDRMTIIFIPRQGVVLDTWSIPAPAVYSQTWEGRPVYAINLVRGEVTSDYLLRLNFNITDGIATRPLVDLQVYGRHIHHANNYTPAFSKFLKEFPNYISMVSEISAYISQIY